MQINNPLQINDWEIKKFLKVILAVQLAMWGVIGLDAIGLQIPILRQLIGFIYLTFVPGIIILRILKLHKLGNIETLLYTVGLSIATLMFTGLFMNTVYPFFGISGPISLVPLIITISAVVLILCVLCYVRDKDFSDPSFIEVGNELSPPALFLLLIPFLAIFGTYLVNFYHSNILLMFLIVIIALIAVLIGFDNFIPKNLYPLAVFVIAISLLFHRSLISMYIIGWDIHLEYYLSNLVMGNSYWDSTIHSTVNAMLSIVMLPPIYSIISDMSLTWVFKIIYPLLFSLVPLGLYRVFQKQTDDNIAFLSIFFFMSMFRFYYPMPRQNIAEFYLILLILAMIDKDINKIKRAVLIIVFGVSLAISHYGTSYIFMFCLIATWLLLFFMGSPTAQKLRNNFHAKFGRKREKLVGNPIPLKVDRTISSTFVLLFIIFALTWYMYLSSSSAFNAIIHLGDHIASSISTDFLNPETVQGLEMMTAQPAPGLLHEVCRIINYLNQIFIIIGCITLLLIYRELKFEPEYAAFSMVNLAILFAAVSVPFFASALNMERVYHITLIFLAPFCVIGGITVFRVLSRVLKVSWTDKYVRNSLKVLSVYFVIFLLYSTGFVWEVAEGYSGSISIGQEGIKKYGDTKEKAGFYCIYILEQDVFSARWLSKNTNKQNLWIYCDSDAKNHVLCSYGLMGRHGNILSPDTTILYDAYIYLRRLNVVDGIMSGPLYNTTEIFLILEKNGKIYLNGGSEIYYGG